MRKVRTQLLATAAVMALGSAAYAADMGVPMKAPPPAPIPYTNWQGFYVGGAIGAVAGGAGVLAGLGVFGLGVLGGLVLGSLIGLIAGAVTSHPVVHVCPNWASLPTVEDRTESLLAAIYESYADLDPQHSRRYAALARAIHATWWPAPPPV